MTFEHDAVVASLAGRASDQVRSGIAALHAGDLLRAEVLLRAALATFDSLQVLLDGTQPPLRKLAVAQKPRDEDADIQPWMAKKHNGGPDGAA